MKVIVTELIGDASVFFYNEADELIYTEGFYGKCTSSYIRKIPDWVEAKAVKNRSISSGHFVYKVV